jgi:hypothetical protein
MISCTKCGNPNPMTTRFCRACGERIDVSYTDVAKSVSQDVAVRQTKEALTHGLNAVTVGGFLLLAALVVSFGLAPAPTLPEPAPALPEHLVPREGAGAAAAALGTVELTSTRLVTRAVLAPITVMRVGADPIAVAGWLKTVAASIQPDGRCTVGDDVLAATGLAALALQALPTEDGIAKAALARTWLNTQVRDFGRKTPLARSLALYALIDAEDLTPAARTTAFHYLIDGKAATWQAWANAVTAAEDRSKDDILVRKALIEPHWNAVYALTDGKAHPSLEAREFMSETALALATGEERMLWAFLAWHLSLAPEDLRTVMAAWTQGTPASVDPVLAKACGPHAAMCVGLLTVGSVLRVPVGWNAAAVQ